MADAYPVSERPKAPEAAKTVSEAVKPAGDGGSNTAKFTAKWFLAMAAGLLGAFYVFHPDETVSMRVRKAVLAPEGDVGEGIDGLIFSCFCIGVCAVLDLCVARFFGPGRYFALHVMVNAINVCFGWSDFAATFSTANPFEMNTCVRAGIPCANKVAMAMSNGIHLWHCLAYKLSPIDVVHHVPTIIVCLLGLFMPWGPALNVNTVVFMGIPGGLDYVLLVLVKLGALRSRVEKNLNQTINVWVRCPGGVVIAFIMTFGALMRPDDFTGPVHRFVHGLLGINMFWNACFFMYRTVDARTRYVLKEAAKSSA